MRLIRNSNSFKCCIRIILLATKPKTLKNSRTWRSLTIPFLSMFNRDETLNQQKTQARKINNSHKWKSRVESFQQKNLFPKSRGNQFKFILTAFSHLMNISHFFSPSLFDLESSTEMCLKLRVKRKRDGKNISRKSFHNKKYSLDIQSISETVSSLISGFVSGYLFVKGVTILALYFRVILSGFQHVCCEVYLFFSKIILYLVKVSFQKKILFVRIHYPGPFSHVYLFIESLCVRLCD